MGHPRTSKHTRNRRLRRDGTGPGRPKNAQDRPPGLAPFSTARTALTRRRERDKRSGSRAEPRRHLFIPFAVHLLAAAAPLSSAPLPPLATALPPLNLASARDDGDHHHAAPRRAALPGVGRHQPAPAREESAPRALQCPVRRDPAARGLGVARPGLRQEGLPPQPHARRQLQPQGLRPQEGDAGAHEPGVHQ
jgi:hypothetical protein